MNAQKVLETVKKVIVPVGLVVLAGLEAWDNYKKGQKFAQMEKFFDSMQSKGKDS